MRRPFAVLLVSVVVAACSSGSDNHSAQYSEPSLEARVTQLDEATVVDVSVGDLDQDGIPEIVLSSSRAPKGPGLQTLAVGPDAASVTAGDSIVLTHDADGNLLVAPSNQNYNFSFAKLVASFARRALDIEFKNLLSRLVVKEASCEVARTLAGWFAEIVKAGLVNGLQLQQLFNAMLGLPPNSTPPDPAQRPDEDFTNCLTNTPQSIVGCLAIRVRYAIGHSVPGRGCGFWDRCDHCYQVPLTPRGEVCPAGDLRSTLCNSVEHDKSGCCNADFVFNKVFLSDLRNMAPMPFDPATGPIAASMPVTLDGSILSALPPEAQAALLLTDLKTAVAACFLNDLGATRNPITLSADLKRRCGTNKTRDGHVFEGWVDQCIRENDSGVYSTITGGGTDTRFSWLNEWFGPIFLDRVRAHFAAQVESALNEIESKGMCCHGSEIVGGTVKINPKGGLDIVADPDAASACSDDSGMSPGDPGTGNGSNAPEGGSGGEGGATDSGEPTGAGGTGGAGSGYADAGEAGSCGTECGPQQSDAHTKKDPHLRTLDGLAYDFQAGGEFLLFELIDDPPGPRAQVRQQPLAADLCPHVTLNTAVAASVNGVRVAVYAQRATPLWIAGTPTTLQPTETRALGAGGAVTALSGDTWQVRWPDGARLRIERDQWRGEHHLDVQLFAPQSWRSRTRGLLGDFDGSSANDFRTRQGTALPTPVAWADFYDSFGASYQIRADESLFEPADEAPFLTFTPPSAPALASMLSPSLLDGVEQTCDDTGVADPTLHEDCVLDVACSGGDSSQSDWLRTATLPSASAQISYDARFNAEHCQTLTPTGYRRVERISVPTDGSSVVTQTPLAFGRIYKVRAWGTFASGADGDGAADAEYLNFSNPPASIADSCSNVDTGIAINAPAPATKGTRWGTECASHSYTLEVLGQGAPLNLSFHDCKLTDNQGTLQVDVLAPTLTCTGGVGTPVALTNGSFETPSAGNKSGYQNLHAGSTVLQGWSIDAGEIDLIQGPYWEHAEGTQSLDMNGIAAGTISQQLTTTPGEVYDVSFALAANTYCAPTVKVLEVSAADQSESFQFDSSGHSYTSMGWQPLHFAFRANGSSTRLTFRSLVTGSCGPALDNVAVDQLVCP